MLVAALILSLSYQAEPHRLVFLGSGRFAQYADLSSLSVEGSAGRIRTFQVADAEFRAGGRAYWGGWSWWSFDCAASTVDRLDFASVHEDGDEGPSTPDLAPAYPAAPGGDAFELLSIACNPQAVEPDAHTVEEAVAHGRASLAAVD